MLELKINNNVIKRLRQAGFYPDTMFASLVTMLCLKNGEIELIDAMDDGSTSKRALVIYYDLLRKGYLDEDKDEESKVLYKLSQRGIDFVEEIISLVPENKVQANEVESWINDWVNLFPEGVTSGNKLVRSDRKSCLLKMKKFLKDYPEYTKDDIMKATYTYVDQFRTDNASDAPTYMKCAVYFIDKRGEGSELAGWCAKIKSEPETISETFVHQNNGLV